MLAHTQKQISLYVLAPLSLPTPDCVTALRQWGDAMAPVSSIPLEKVSSKATVKTDASLLEQGAAVLGRAVNGTWGLRVA